MMKIKGFYDAHSVKIDDLKIGDLVIIDDGGGRFAGFITEINGYIVVLNIGTENLIEYVAYDDTVFEVVDKGTQVTLVI